MDRVTFTHFAHGDEGLQIVFAPLAIAQARGYFAAEGIEVETLAPPEPPYGWLRVVAGESDVGAGYFSFASDPRYRGAMRAGLVLEENRRGHGFTHLLARKGLVSSGALNGYASLRGKRIGLLPNRGDDYMAYHGALRLGGLTLDDVTPVPVPHGGPERYAALESGAVDLVIARRPRDVVHEIDGGWVERWKSGYEINPDLQAQFLLFSRAFSDERPDVAARFCAGWLRGARAYVDAFDRGIERDAMIDLLVRITGETRELITSMPPIYFAPNGAPDMARLARDRDVLVERGLYDPETPLEDVVDLRPAQAAVARIGRYDEDPL